MIIINDLKKVNKMLCDAPLFQRKRVTKNEDDFGDSLTIGLKVKRRNVRFPDFQDHDFGVFIGDHSIGTYRILEFKPSMIVVYPNAIEMHKDWILDQS